MSARELVWIGLLLYVLYLTKPIQKDLEMYCRGHPLNLGFVQLLICDKLVVGICGKIYIVNNVPYLYIIESFLPFIDNYSEYLESMYTHYQQQSFKVVAFKPMWSDKLVSYTSKINSIFKVIAHELYHSFKQPKWYQWYNSLECETFINDGLWLVLLVFVCYSVKLLIKRKVNVIIMILLTVFFGSYEIDGPLQYLSHLNIFNYLANMSFIYNMDTSGKSLSALIIWLCSIYFGKLHNPLSTPTIGTVGMDGFLMGFHNEDVIDLLFRLSWSVIFKYGISSLFVGIPFDVKGYFGVGSIAAIIGVFSKLFY